MCAFIKPAPARLVPSFKWSSAQPSSNKLYQFPHGGLPLYTVCLPQTEKEKFLDYGGASHSEYSHFEFELFGFNSELKKQPEIFQPGSASTDILIFSQTCVRILSCSGYTLLVNEPIGCNVISKFECFSRLQPMFDKTRRFVLVPKWSTKSWTNTCPCDFHIMVFVILCLLNENLFDLLKKLSSCPSGNSKHGNLVCICLL